MTITMAAEAPGPYVHVDNRALVLSNGQTGIVFNLAQARWLCETLSIVAEEGRATRMQGQHVFGGFAGAGSSIVLFGGTYDAVVTVRLSADAFAKLRDELEPGR